MIWTSLPEKTPTDEVLSFYRSRRQIELSFKRMTSLFGLGPLPKKDPARARAWLHGKLLASVLVQRATRAAEATAPWRY